MSRHISPIILFLFFAAASVDVVAQNHNTSKSNNSAQVVRINQMDVIYEDDEEYMDIINNPEPITSEDESYMYDRPPMLPPPPMEDAIDDDDPDMMPQVLQTHEDEGAESEDEILYASFDSQTIHYPKLDINTIVDPVHIVLTHPDRDENFSIPITATARASSHYGPRRRRFHYGLDLAAPKGEPIYAMFDGTVRISVRNRSYGNLVVIRHSNGLETYYAHMSARNVEPGQTVKAGDCIGLCGNTGRSYGSHLHLEIRYMGNALNPEDVIDPNTRQLLSNELTLTKNSFRKASKGGSKSSGGGTYSSDGKQFYKVRSGDTLSRIAKRNGTTVTKLCQLNHLKRESVLQIGQRIRIR